METPSSSDYVTSVACVACQEVFPVGYPRHVVEEALDHDFDTTTVRGQRLNLVGQDAQYALKTGWCRKCYEVVFLGKIWPQMNGMAAS